MNQSRHVMHASAFMCMWSAVHAVYILQPTVSLRLLSVVTDKSYGHYGHGMIIARILQ